MRIQSKNDIRVIIYPRLRQSGDWNGSFQTSLTQTAKLQNEYAAEAERIAASIRKHAEFDAQVSVAWDSATVCSFCRNEFGKDETADLFPWCCEAAQLEYLRANPDADASAMVPKEDVPYIGELRAKIASEGVGI